MTLKHRRSGRRRALVTLLALESELATGLSGWSLVTWADLGAVGGTKGRSAPEDTAESQGPTSCVPAHWPQSLGFGKASLSRFSPSPM